MNLDADLASVSALLSKRSFDQAETACRNILLYAGDNVKALQLLATIRVNLGDKPEATLLLKRAVELSPAALDAWRGLAELTAKSDPEYAEACLRRVLAVDPEDSMTRYLLVRRLANTLRKDEAHHECNLLLDARKTNRHILSYLAAHFRERGDLPRLERAEKEWARHIARTFDDFAVNFDEKLGSLGYQGPQLAQLLVEKVLSPTDVGLHVADVGCGTGLFGPLIAPRKKSLVGVDLSAKMVARAEERGVYDELVVADANNFFPTRLASFDLIACLDVLIYVGELELFFGNLVVSLKQRAYVVATIEVLDASSAHPFILRHAGRYAHKEDYLVNALQKAGLRIVETSREPLRIEAGVSVPTLVFIAERI